MRYAEAAARVEAGRLPVVLVTLETPGRTFRAASEPVEVPDADGSGPLLYGARLVGRVDFAAEVDLLALEVSEFPASLAIEMVLDEETDPRQLELDGGMLSASRCEVAMVWPGQDWRDRRVVLPHGTVSGLELGLAGEPIRFTAEASAPPAGAPLCDPARDMGTDFPASTGYSSLDGKAWPVAVGRVYGIPAYKIGDVDPGAGVARAIAIAGHHSATTVVADFTIYEDGATYTPAGTLTVINTTDSEGGAICYIQSDTGSDFQSTDGAFTVDCTGGCAHSARGPGPAYRADGVVAWLLSRCGHPVDWTECEHALEKLRGWGMGLYGDTSDDTLSVLRDRVLRWVPVVERQGRRGIALRYVDPFTDPPEKDLVFGVHLVDRLGGLVQLSDPDDLRNEVTIDYAYDHYRGEYTKRVTIGADQSARCRVSQQLYGVRAEALSCNTIWQDATAAQSALWLATRLALPRFGQRYLLDPDLYWLEEDTIVRLTDSDLGVTDRRGYVRRVNPLMDPPECLVEILPAVGGGMEG